jgi:hypothetical protein
LESTSLKQPMPGLWVPGGPRPGASAALAPVWRVMCLGRHVTSPSQDALRCAAAHRRSVYGGSGWGLWQEEVGGASGRKKWVGPLAGGSGWGLWQEEVGGASGRRKWVGLWQEEVGGASGRRKYSSL